MVLHCRAGREHTLYSRELEGIGLVDIPATVPGEETSDTTPTMANLLGDLQAAGEMEEEVARLGSFYVGDGLPPVPARIATRNGKWEFMGMYELLPEFWTQKEEEASPKNYSRAKAKKRIQYISVWHQCFALYVSVMASRNMLHGKHPTSKPGVRWICMDIVRYGILPSGCSYGAQEMVKGQPITVHRVLHRKGQKGSLL